MSRRLSILCNSPDTLFFISIHCMYLLYIERKTDKSSQYDFVILLHKDNYCTFNYIPDFNWIMDVMTNQLNIKSYWNCLKIIYTYYTGLLYKIMLLNMKIVSKHFQQQVNPFLINKTLNQFSCNSMVCAHSSSCTHAWSSCCWCCFCWACRPYILTW